MSALMGVSCRSDDGDSDGSEDATVAGGNSAPQSPCMWQSVKRQTQTASVGDKENAGSVHANKPRVVPLDTFFGAPTFSLSTLIAARKQSDTTQSPVAVQQSSSVVATAKETLLLADQEAEMARKQLQQSQSPSSSIWSSPVAPQASAAASPDSSPSPPAPVLVQVTSAPATHSCDKPSIPARARALVLSPMSQLNVLSQISEMADRQAQLAATPASVASSAARTDNASKSEARQQPAKISRQHAWAPALKTGKKRLRRESVASPPAQQTEKATKKKASGRSKKAAAQQQNQLSVEIAKDMVDWEICSEDIFLGDSNGDSEDDTWIFEDISDSDFE